jgi:hypothetical protein
MKIRTNRLLGLFLFSIIGVASIAQAGSLLLMDAGGPATAADPATTAWVAQVNVVGAGTCAPNCVSGTRKTVVDTFIKCLKSNSLFTILDRYWLLAGENVASAQTDMIGLASWTSHGTINFAANAGYTGDGTSGYLDTNFVPSTAGGHFALNSASYGTYLLNNRTVSNGNQVTMGVLDGSATYSEVYGNSTSNHTVSLSDSGVAPAGATATTARGSYILSRAGASGSATKSLYVNGTLWGSVSQATTSLSTHALFISGLDNGGSPGFFTSDQHAAAFIGGGMDATQSANFETCQNTMMSNIGINVH